MEHHSKPKTFWETRRDVGRRMRRSEDVDQFTVRAENSGLVVAVDSCRGFRGRTETWSIPWAEIAAVVAFKTDNFIYDTIWVAVHTQRQGGEIGVATTFPDTADGWVPTLESLPRHLPGCEPFEIWFGAVAFPAFAQNPRLLYDRAAE